MKKNKSLMDGSLKKKIDAFYAKHGRRHAEFILTTRGISQSMAQKLLAGTYPHQPNSLFLRAIMDALETK